MPITFDSHLKTSLLLLLLLLLLLFLTLSPAGDTVVIIAVYALPPRES